MSRVALMCFQWVRDRIGLTDTAAIARGRADALRWESPCEGSTDYFRGYVEAYIERRRAEMWYV